MKLHALHLRFGRITQQPKAQQYDVVIGGGGCNGTALFRELALRGLSVLLVNKSDPDRASRNNSRLMHGNMRYMPYFEFKLVKEARQEVNRWLTNAKHLVSPIKMVLPLYRGNDLMPNTWLFKPFTIWPISLFAIPATKIGLMMYDRFSKLIGLEKGQKPLPSHQSIRAKEIHKQIPGLKTSGLKKAFSYYDGFVTFPERIELESIQDALVHNPKAQALNHASITLVKDRPEQGPIQVSFQNSLDKSAHTVEAKLFVNAAGPKVDDVIQTVNPNRVKKRDPKMGPTKGTHILVKNTPGLKNALYAVSNKGRLFFTAPCALTTGGPNQPDHLLIGPTDTKKKDCTSNDPTRDEVQLFVDSFNTHFPSQTPTPIDSVTTAISAFRPLPAGKGGASDVTRSHRIDKEGRRFDLIGGKLTTQRSLAEETADAIVKALGKPLKGETRKASPTRKRPLPGSVGITDMNAYRKEHAAKIMAQYKLDPTIANQLVSRYGSQYPKVLALLENAPHLKERLIPELPIIKAQALYAVTHEGAETLTDVMTNSLALDALSCKKDDNLIETILDIISPRLELTAKERWADKQTYLTHIARREQWRKS